jgi:hypothetical protein
MILYKKPMINKEKILVMGQMKVVKNMETHNKVAKNPAKVA